MSGRQELPVLKASQDCCSNGVQLSEALMCFWTWPVCAIQQLVHDTGGGLSPVLSGALSQGSASSHSLEGELTAQGPFLELLPLLQLPDPFPLLPGPVVGKLRLGSASRVRQRQHEEKHTLASLPSCPHASFIF